MNFRIDKCANITFKKGRMAQTDSIVLEFVTTFRKMEQVEAYKYRAEEDLRYYTAYPNEGENMKRTLGACASALKYRVEFTKKRISAKNTLAAPVVRYSLHIHNSNINDIKLMDIKKRKLIICLRMHHTKVSIISLYGPISESNSE